MSEDSQKMPDKREHWHWFWLEIGIFATILGGGFAAWQAIYENPRKEREQRQKEFSIKLFDEKKAIYFEIVDLMSRIYHAENPDDMKPLMNRFELLIHGRYRLVIANLDEVKQQLEKENLSPLIRPVEHYLDAAKEYIAAMEGNDLKTKAKKRMFFNMQDYLLKMV